MGDLPAFESLACVHFGRAKDSNHGSLPRGSEAAVETIENTSFDVEH